MPGAGETRMCTLKTFILSEIVPSDSVSSRSLLSLNPRGICFRPIFSLSRLMTDHHVQDRGAWRAAVHGVTKSWTQLRD